MSQSKAGRDLAAGACLDCWHASHGNQTCGSTDDPYPPDWTGPKYPCQCNHTVTREERGNIVTITEKEVG